MAKKIKTLNDLIKQKADFEGKTFKIGNSNGSGFWFIGTLEELEESIDNEEAKAKESLDKLFTQAKEVFICDTLYRKPYDQYLQDGYETAVRWAKRIGEVDSIVSYEEWKKTKAISELEYAERMANSVLNARTRFFAIRKFMKHFTRLRDCDIVEKYMSITEPDQGICIIECFGDGPWWDTSELVENPEGKFDKEKIDDPQ